MNTKQENSKPLAWITGGGSGIGLASAHALASAGFTLALSGRRAEQLSQALDSLKKAGHEALALPLDVSDAQAVQAAADQLNERFGKVSVLVNSAGTNVPDRFWDKLSAADFAKVTAINLNGVANTACAVLPAMRSAGGGTLVVISSWAGWRFTSFTGAAYGASKHGLAPLVETINDQEGQHGVRATLICPGEVATPILKSRPAPPSDADIARMLIPEDVAQAVSYAATAPARVCINELVISPSWNRMYLGLDELKKK